MRVLATTPEARLAAIDAAIDAFLSNGAIQEYTHSEPGGGTITIKREPLEVLERLRDRYLGQIAAKRNGGAINYFRRGGVQ